MTHHFNSFSTTYFPHLHVALNSSFTLSIIPPFNISTSAAACAAAIAIFSSCFLLGVLQTTWTLFHEMQFPWPFPYAPQPPPHHPAPTMPTPHPLPPQPTRYPPTPTLLPPAWPTSHPQSHYHVTAPMAEPCHPPPFTAPPQPLPSLINSEPPFPGIHSRAFGNSSLSPLFLRSHLQIRRATTRANNSSTPHTSCCRHNHTDGSSGRLYCPGLTCCHRSIHTSTSRQPTTTTFFTCSSHTFSHYRHQPSSNHSARESIASPPSRHRHHGRRRPKPQRSFGQTLHPRIPPQLSNLYSFQTTSLHFLQLLLLFSFTQSIPSTSPPRHSCPQCGFQQALHQHNHPCQALCSTQHLSKLSPCSSRAQSLESSTSLH